MSARNRKLAGRGTAEPRRSQRGRLAATLRALSAQASARSSSPPGLSDSHVPPGRPCSEARTPFPGPRSPHTLDDAVEPGDVDDEAVNQSLRAHPWSRFR